MVDTVGFEVQVKRGKGWETLQRFGADDAQGAKELFNQPPRDGDVTGVRWMAETIDGNGEFRQRSMGFRSINGTKTLGQGSGGQGSGGQSPGPETAAASKTAAKPKSASPRTAAPRTTAPKGAAQAAAKPTPYGKTAQGRVATSNAPVGRAGGPSDSGQMGPESFSFMRFIMDLFAGGAAEKAIIEGKHNDAAGGAGADGRTAPNADAQAVAKLVITSSGPAAAGAVAALPQPTIPQPTIPQPTIPRGDMTVFEDEVDQPGPDLAVTDATSLQFKNFLECVRGFEAFNRASTLPESDLAITLFCFGAIMLIEKDIDFKSSRGGMIAAECLKLIGDKHTEAAFSMETLNRYTQHASAFQWIKAGNSAYQIYSMARMEELRELVVRVFKSADDPTKILGSSNPSAIFFTDIVDSTALTQQLGDDKAQEIVDHHDILVLEAAKQFGGSRVKHMGDGLMLAFPDAGTMAECAILIVDTIRRLEGGGPVHPYQIRCGGHFGEAIRKNNDYFGQTVQMAARICGAAEGNQARFSADLGSDVARLSNFKDCGGIALKGIKVPVRLVAY
jgi:class 3 adenylate cyclase